MSSFTSFVPSTAAIASQINNNFAFLDGNMTPHSSGALSDNQHGLGATSNRWAHIAVVSINAQNIICSGTATFHGPVTMNSTATFNGPVTINSTLTVNSPATFASAITINGPAIFNTSATFNTVVALDGGFDTGQNIPMKFVIRSIGDWNMDATAGVDVAHGLTKANIRNVTGLIRADDDVRYYTISQFRAISADNVYFNFISTGAITINRLTSGDFDGTGFDATTFNRGWVVFWHV